MSTKEDGVEFAVKTVGAGPNDEHNFVKDFTFSIDMVNRNETEIGC